MGSSRRDQGIRPGGASTAAINLPPCSPAAACPIFPSSHCNHPLIRPPIKHHTHPVTHRNSRAP